MNDVILDSRGRWDLEKTLGRFDVTNEKRVRVLLLDLAATARQWGRNCWWNIVVGMGLVVCLWVVGLCEF